jgi:hypothetical protein
VAFVEGSVFGGGEYTLQRPARKVDVEAFATPVKIYRTYIAMKRNALSCKSAVNYPIFKVHKKYIDVSHGNF